MQPYNTRSIVILTRLWKAMVSCIEILIRISPIMALSLYLEINLVGQIIFTFPVILFI
jgi:hypothetical protein